MTGSPLARRRAIQSYADLGRKSYERSGHPAALVEALLDALNDNLCAARRAVLHGRADQRSKPLTRACMIIYGLHRTLDPRRSPTTAKRLADIYRYLLARINRVNQKNGAQVLSELIGLVNTLRSAWSAAPGSVGPKNSPAAVHLAQGKLPAQVLALNELNRRHPGALGFLEAVDEQVVTDAHGGERVPHAVRACDFAV